MERNELESLERAVSILDGQSSLARELTKRTGKVVKQQHVWNWLNRDKRLPDRFAFAVEAATEEKGEKISAKQLCPDLFPKPVAA